MKIIATRRKRVIFAALTVVLVAAIGAGLRSAQAGDTPMNAEAKVYFIWPKDGAVLRDGKVWVRFGLRNAGIAPAGVASENSGHHHLVIDAELPGFDEEIPADQNYVHFGKGQSEALVELAPGEHTLQLLFADHLHVPHDPPVHSEKITVTVQ